MEGRFAGEGPPLPPTVYFYSCQNSVMFPLSFCFKKGRHIRDKNYRSALNNRKTRQNMEEQQFQMLDNRQPQSLLPKREKANEISPVRVVGPRGGANPKNLVVSLSGLKVGIGVQGVQDGWNLWNRVLERRDLHGEKIPETAEACSQVFRSVCAERPRRKFLRPRGEP